MTNDFDPKSWHRHPDDITNNFDQNSPDNMINDFYPNSWCGHPDESTPAPLAVWMNAKNELFASRPVPEELWHKLPNFLEKWKETNNPHYVDYAILLCAIYLYDFPKCLSKEIVNRAQKSLNGECNGTKEKITRDDHNSTIFHWVSCFVALDISLTKATQKAAARYLAEFGKKKKASTIEKDYQSRIKAQAVNGKNRVQQMQQIYKNDPDHKAAMLALAESLHCPDELIGKTR